MAFHICDESGCLTAHHDNNQFFFLNFVVKYEARLQNGALVSESNEGVEFRVFDGKLSLLSKFMLHNIFGKLNV